MAGLRGFQHPSIDLYRLHHLQSVCWPALATHPSHIQKQNNLHRIQKQAKVRMSALVTCRSAWTVVAPQSRRKSAGFCRGRTMHRTCAHAYAARQDTARGQSDTGQVEEACQHLPVQNATSTRSSKSLEPELVQRGSTHLLGMLAPKRRVGQDGSR